jgi:hypothetical protein
VLFLTTDKNKSSFEPLVNSSFHEQSTTSSSPSCSAACTVSPYFLDTILVNFNQLMGVDLAFVVRRSKECPLAVPEYRLVVIHSRDRECAQLSDMLKRLNPATQYLGNSERLAVLRGDQSFPLPRRSLYLSPHWSNYQSFMANHEELQSNWIRIGLTARPVAYEAYQELSQLAQTNRQNILPLYLEPEKDYYARKGLPVQDANLCCPLEKFYYEEKPYNFAEEVFNKQGIF